VNTIVWIVAGLALAWLAFAYLHFNRERGLVIASIIGAGGAYFGGSVLAPLLGHPAPAVGDFMPFPLVVAAATAVALLYLGEYLYERYGV
jgi:uncharacterized membrane protein YeaQ/YmgE (transglycosylase-associated protein family)